MDIINQTHDLIIDPERFDRYEDPEYTLPVTNIFVRAKTEEGRWISADITILTRTSLMAWLRSRGGRNLWAENVILQLLHYESIEDPNYEVPNQG